MTFKLSLPIRAVASGLLALAFAAPVAAQIYKWVDEKGVVNYGSAPPPGRTAKELSKDASISVVPAPAPPSPAAARNPNDARVEQLERALAAERATRQSEEQSAEDRRLAAIAQCEKNRGVDCEENPYEIVDGAYGYGYGYYPPGRRPYLRRHPDGMPIATPLPAVKPPPRPVQRPIAAPRPMLW